MPLEEAGLDDLREFSCGRKSLDDFLFQEASEYHVSRLGFTSLVFHEDFDGLVGYFSLSNDALPLETSENFDLGLNVDVALGAIPATKIGKFAVRRELQGKGVGQSMMDLLVGESLDSDALSASRLLVTDAANDPSVLGFYRKCGFIESLWAEKQRRHHGKGKPPTVKMYMDVYAWVRRR